MEEVIHKLRNIEGVKGVEKRSKTLKINLFSRPIPSSEAVEIPGDLRKISQNIRNILEKGRNEGLYKSWEWMQKPEKKCIRPYLTRSDLFGVRIFSACSGLFFASLLTCFLIISNQIKPAKAPTGVT